MPDKILNKRPDKYKGLVFYNRLLYCNPKKEGRSIVLRSFLSEYVVK
jgi:hypothetical protein